jgi:hypothetical protein|tara:strand:- start:177 stop:332 length:156 start_codon:yes stop_codon:yes gene_type:complete
MLEVVEELLIIIPLVQVVLVVEEQEVARVLQEMLAQLILVVEVVQLQDKTV